MQIKDVSMKIYSDHGGVGMKTYRKVKIIILSSPPCLSLTLSYFIIFFIYSTYHNLKVIYVHVYLFTLYLKKKATF